MLRHLLGVEGVVALPREHGRDPRAPVRLDGGTEARLVVDEDVVLGGKAPLDVGQLLLLVDVDEDVAPERLEEPGALPP